MRALRIIEIFTHSHKDANAHYQLSKHDSWGKKKRNATMAREGAVEPTREGEKKKMCCLVE